MNKKNEQVEVKRKWKGQWKGSGKAVKQASGKRWRGTVFSGRDEAGTGRVSRSVDVDRLKGKAGP